VVSLWQAILSFFIAAFKFCFVIFSFSPGNSQGKYQRHGILGFLDHYIYESLSPAENLTLEVLPNKSRSGIDGISCV
jgi:hypothetical protein